MKILFLYSEYVNYLDGLMRRLVEDHEATVHVVSWDKNLLKPVNIPQIPRVTFQKSSDLSVDELVELIEDFDPVMVYISGWMDAGYLAAIKRARNRKSFTTVCGFDDNWLGSFRQRLGAIYFRLSLRKYFDKAWIAGARQYHYVRQLGYADSDIAYNLLSCDTEKFCDGVNFDQRKEASLRTFFYVGNFRDVKGTDLLAEAYKIYRETLSGSCKLVCIGQGPLREQLEDELGITVLPYMTSSELIETTKSFDIFVFPSRKDQWGVTLHEFAVLGFPLISSSGTGATERFLIDGFNGLMFNPGDPYALAEGFKKFEEMPTETLKMFGLRSRELGRSVTSEISAASLVSLIPESTN